MTRAPNRRYASDTEELLDRVRRTETRLTKYLEWAGFDVQTHKASWTGTHVEVPTPKVSLQEVLNAVPGGWEGRSVVIMCRGETLGKLTLPFKPS